MATISNLTIASRNNGFTASGILDGILFNSIGVSDGQGLAAKWNRNDGPWKTSGSTELSRFAVNAVDIDWNGAQWPALEPETPETINTTGDLINAIKWASTQGPTTELPNWTEASGGPDDDDTLEAGESFVVPKVSQATNGQVTVENKTFTLPQHKTDDTVNTYNLSNDGIITEISLDQYGHVNTVKSEEIITILWDDNGATNPHEGGSLLVVKGDKVILPTTNPRRRIYIKWDSNGGSIPNWQDTVSDYFDYTFEGWYTTPYKWIGDTFDGTQIDNNTIPSINTTYYARWIAPTSIEFPEDMDNKTPIRNGYTLLGWATTSTAATPDVTENTVPSTDVTYYAVWKLNNPYWYQGVTNPADLEHINSTNNDLDGWTNEGLSNSSNPTSIKFGVQDEDLEDHNWYFAVPTIWNFTKMSDVLGTTDLPTNSYDVTTETIDGISYTVFHWLDATDAMYGTIQ